MQPLPGGPTQPPPAAGNPPGLRPLPLPQTITTETIQQLLEENAKLIRAIQENQNAGKLQACAQFQQNLQQNLMYLAAVADAQPAPPPPAPPAAAAAPQQQQGGAAYAAQPPQAVGLTPTQPVTPYGQQQQQQQQPGQVTGQQPMQPMPAQAPPGPSFA